AYHSIELCYRLNSMHDLRHLSLAHGFPVAASELTPTLARLESFAVSSSGYKDVNGVTVKTAVNVAEFQHLGPSCTRLWCNAAHSASLRNNPRLLGQLTHLRCSLTNGNDLSNLCRHATSLQHLDIQFIIGVRILERTRCFFVKL